MVLVKQHLEVEFPGMEKYSYKRGTNEASSYCFGELSGILAKKNPSHLISEGWDLKMCA